MRPIRLFGAAILLMTWAAPRAAAQIKAGEAIGVPDLRELCQTPAKSPIEFVGRAVLYEFFEFW